MATIDLESLQPLFDEIDSHPIYGAIRTLADLRVFATHHAFAVWDFMCLIKYLQSKVAPPSVPWYPAGSPDTHRLLNLLAMEEETDVVPGAGGGKTYASHFEHYCRAMDEIGADGTLPLRFLELVRSSGVDQGLYSELVPLPARYFCETTFAYIRDDKPHEVAAALAVARERIIPGMFRRFLDGMGVTEDEAPSMHFYLNRHVHLDADVRGRLSMQLIHELCADDPTRIEEAETAAEEALCARIRFWDGIHAAITARQPG